MTKQPPFDPRKTGDNDHRADAERLVVQMRRQGNKSRDEPNVKPATPNPPTLPSHQGRAARSQGRRMMRPSGPPVFPPFSSVVAGRRPDKCGQHQKAAELPVMERPTRRLCRPY
jgi:hypothetical protein